MAGQHPEVLDLFRLIGNRLAITNTSRSLNCIKLLYCLFWPNLVHNTVLYSNHLLAALLKIRIIWYWLTVVALDEGDIEILKTYVSIICRLIPGGSNSQGRVTITSSTTVPHLVAYSLAMRAGGSVAVMGLLPVLSDNRLMRESKFMLLFMRTREQRVYAEVSILGHFWWER